MDMLNVMQNHRFRGVSKFVVLPPWNRCPSILGVVGRWNILDMEFNKAILGIQRLPSDESA